MGFFPPPYFLNESNISMRSGSNHPGPLFCVLVVVPRATTTLKVEALWALKKILQKYETFCSKPIDKRKILCYNAERNNLFQGEAMSRTTDSKKQIILDFINEYYGSYGETPRCVTSRQGRALPLQAYTVTFLL